MHCLKVGQSITDFGLEAYVVKPSPLLWELADGWLTHPFSRVGWAAGDNRFISSSGPGVKVAPCSPGADLQPQPSHKPSSCSSLSINKKMMPSLSRKFHLYLEHLVEFYFPIISQKWLTGVATERLGQEHNKMIIGLYSI